MDGSLSPPFWEKPSIACVCTGYVLQLGRDEVGNIHHYRRWRKQDRHQPRKPLSRTLRTASHAALEASAVSKGFMKQLDRPIGPVKQLPLARRANSLRCSPCHPHVAPSPQGSNGKRHRSPISIRDAATLGVQIKARPESAADAPFRALMSPQVPNRCQGG